MKLYAVTSASESQRASIRAVQAGMQEAVRLGFRNGLLSYAVLRTPGQLINAVRHFDSVLLDSGAFSAFNSGRRVKLEGYIEFCKRYGHLVDAYACLDVIGDDGATARNQERMEAAGLMPIPTFHFGERWETLTRLARDYDYIAVGCMHSLGTVARQEFLDGCWRIIRESPRWPFKVHGWAMTDAAIMERYPWYSVDSLTWGVGAIYGSSLELSGPRRRVLRQVQRKKLKNRAMRQDGPAATGLRLHASARALQQYTDYVTRLWVARGIEWKEADHGKSTQGRSEADH